MVITGEGIGRKSGTIMNTEMRSPGPAREPRLLQCDLAVEIARKIICGVS